MDINTLTFADSLTRPGAVSDLQSNQIARQTATALNQHRVTRRISGEARILEKLGALQKLAMCSGQAGELDQLPYYLSSAIVRAKKPHLLLFENPDGSPYAAVLLSEYRAGALPTRVFMSLDFTGERTVIAPAHLRPAIAVAAADHLLQRGAVLVVASVTDGDFDPVLTAARPGLRRRHQRSAVLHKTTNDVWHLAGDFDETLKSIGHNTRRNFRRDTRVLEASHGAVYVPSADITEDDFLELNRQSSHPVPEVVARWRHSAAQTFSYSRLAGIRAADGKWLSIVGLRSRDGITDIDWQMNLTNIKGISLVTALRAYLLRDEIERGTRSLRFDHGTTHSMQAGLTEHRISHVVMTQALVSPDLLYKVAARVLPVDSLLVSVLKEPELNWQKGDRRS